MSIRNLSLFFALFLYIFSAAESDYEKGLSAFLENDREEAIEHFMNSVEAGENLAESHLALSITHSMLLNGQASFDHFQRFMVHADNPYPYLIALWSSGDIGLGGYKKDDTRIDFLEELIQNPKTPGKLRAMCYDALGRHYKHSGDFDDAREASINIGMIQNWSAVGPFENLSASGYNKDFGAVDHPEPTHNFTSTYGAPVKWFETKGPKIEQWLDLDYYFDAGNSLIYSQTFIDAPSKEKVHLRLGVTGSVKVWLNDHLVFDQSEERDNDIDTYIIETELDRGNNRILVQIGASDVENSEFILRITDEDGNNIPGLKSEAFGSRYSKTKPSSKVLKPYEEEYFEDLVEKSDDILHEILLAKAYSRNGKKYLARKTFNAAIAQAPNSSYLQLNLAYVYMSEGNRTGLATVISWLKQNDLRSPVSLTLTFSEAMESANYETADSILDLYQTEFGATATYFEKAIELHIAQENWGTVTNLIDMAYDNYREVGKFVDYKSQVLGSNNNKAKKAIKVVKKYLKHNYDYDMYVKLAGLYFDAKNSVGGVEVYNDLQEMLPYFASPSYTLASAYNGVGAYYPALDYIETAIEIAPYRSEYWGLKGMIYEGMEEYADAEEAYKRCIELYPNSYDIRERLRLLNEEKSLYDLFTNEDLDEIYENSPSKEDYPDDNSLILRQISQNIVYEGGGSEERVVMFVKLFNSAGIDEWKEYIIPVYNFQDGVVEKIEVLKQDGSHLEAERDGAEVVFTNLEPGDAILVIYKLKNHYFGKLAFNFWDQHFFTRSYPYLENRYSLLIHKDVEFQHTFSNGGFEPEKESKGEYELYVWSKTNQPSVKREDYMSRYVDFGEVLSISTFPDWTYISNWYSDLAATKSKPDFEVKETVAELFEGKENLTDREKVEIIYTFIVKNIRYSSVSFRQSGLIPQKATSVLNTKIGDCKDVSTLFVAMCKEAGIEDVGLVLINTRDNGQKDLMLPSISFNHCIGRVTLDGVTHYVELTSENYGFLTYGDNLLHSYALEIYDEAEGKEVEGFIFNPENRNKNVLQRTSTSEIDGKNMVVAVENIETGNWGSYKRYLYKDESEEKRREYLIKDLNEEHKNATLEDLEFEDFDSLTNEFKYSYSFKIENHVSKIAGLNIFVIPWADAISSAEFVSDEERSYPLELWKFMNYDRVYQQITIELPSGTRLAERPKNVTIDSKFATYKLTFKIVGNKITATRELTPKVQVVQPEDFEELRKFISEIIENDTQNIAYK
ncbi:DUF3857 domain-containing protein [bacterium]|nr:DUF3857 domain-containing protein [bacterium]